MNSLDRAKRFIAGKATKLALTIVPLAAIAVGTAHTAKAGVILGSSGSCTVTVGTGNCSFGQIASGGGNPNVNWIGISSGLLTPDPASGSAISLNASGTGSGFISSGGTIPLSWDFFINHVQAAANGASSNISDVANWSIQFGVNDSGSTVAFSQSGSAAIGSEVKGIGSLNVDAASILGYTVSLNVTGPQGSFTVNIPGGKTLDLNPVVTPEPASIFLGGAGLGALMMLRRRRKTQRG